MMVEGKRIGGFVKAVHPSRPDWAFYLPKEDKKLIKQFSARPIFPEACERPCTTVMTLLPKVPIDGHSGMGYYMINVDGYRVINAYVISDPIFSTAQRGFTLELSFSVNPFVYGVGVIGETSYFFNFECYFDPGVLSHGNIGSETSDLTTIGSLPWIGGPSAAHILRIPVMGPYVRATVFNEDSVSHQVEVKAYLTT